MKLFVLVIALLALISQAEAMSPLRKMANAMKEFNDEKEEAHKTIELEKR